MHQEKGRWVTDSIEASRQPEGGRNFATYALVLGFKKEDLEKKRILDLGVGPEARFAKQIAEQGINADVVGISPDLISERHRKRLATTKPRCPYHCSIRAGVAIC